MFSHKSFKADHVRLTSSKYTRSLAAGGEFPSFFFKPLFCLPHLDWITVAMVNALMVSKIICVSGMYVCMFPLFVSRCYELYVVVFCFCLSSLSRPSSMCVSKLESKNSAQIRESQTPYAPTLKICLTPPPPTPLSISTVVPFVEGTLTLLFLMSWLLVWVIIFCLKVTQHDWWFIWLFAPPSWSECDSWTKITSYCRQRRDLDWRSLGERWMLPCSWRWCQIGYRRWYAVHS